MPDTAVPSYSHSIYSVYFGENALQQVQKNFFLRLESVLVPLSRLNESSSFYFSM